MRLGDMSLTDYLMAEFDLRERQRKERMKDNTRKCHSCEHWNTNGCAMKTSSCKWSKRMFRGDMEQIKAKIEFYADNYAEPFEIAAYYHCLKIINDQMEGELNG